MTVRVCTCEAGALLEGFPMFNHCCTRCRVHPQFFSGRASCAVESCASFTVQKYYIRFLVPPCTVSKTVRIDYQTKFLYFPWKILLAKLMV